MIHYASVEMLLNHIKSSVDVDPWAIDMLEGLLKPTPIWIPTSERNPHTSGTYIVAIRVYEGDDKYILSSACYFDGSDTWYNDNRLNHERPYVTNKVIAWMPLPEPPKDGEAELIAIANASATRAFERRVVADAISEAIKNGSDV